MGSLSLFVTLILPSCVVDVIFSQRLQSGDQTLVCYFKLETGGLAVCAAKDYIATRSERNSDRIFFSQFGNKINVKRHIS